MAISSCAFIPARSKAIRFVKFTFIPNRATGLPTSNGPVIPTRPSSAITRRLAGGRGLAFPAPRSRRRMPRRSEGDVEFATIPFEFPFARLMEIIKSAVGENLPLAQAVEELRRHGHPELPRANGTPVATWTAQQEQALARIVNIDEGRRVWMGSLEITELIRRRLTQEISLARRFQPFQPLRRPPPGQGILVQRQRGIDHLRRDRAHGQGHARRSRDQIAVRRFIQFSFRVAGRQI